jgi:hypothetical protein
MQKRIFPVILAGFLAGACQNTGDGVEQTMKANKAGTSAQVSVDGAYSAEEIAALEKSAIAAAPEFIADSDVKDAAKLTRPTETEHGPDETIVASVNKGVLVEKYTPPPTGAVFTWRNNWASLPPVISYKVAGPVKVKDEVYIKFSSVSGLEEPVNAYYRMSDFNLKAYRSDENEAITSFRPVEQRYRFPLKAGDRWRTAWQSKDHRKGVVTTGGGVVEVIGLEMLDLPAGRMRAVKVRMPTDKNAPKDMVHHIWFSPELGVTVKEEIVSGPLNWTQVLAKAQLPG